MNLLPGSFRHLQLVAIVALIVNTSPCSAKNGKTVGDTGLSTTEIALAARVLASRGPEQQASLAELNRVSDNPDLKSDGAVLERDGAILIHQPVSDDLFAAGNVTRINVADNGKELRIEVHQQSNGASGGLALLASIRIPLDENGLPIFGDSSADPPGTPTANESSVGNSVSSPPASLNSAGFTKFVPFSPDSFFAATATGLSVPNQWAIRHVGYDAKFAESLKKPAKTDARIVVAVLDTGIDLSHPELQGQLWMNTDEVPGNGKDDDFNGFVDDIHGWNFVADDSTLNDLHGHGTAVAGIVAARSDDRGMTGINPRARIMPLKVAGKNGISNGLTHAKAIQYAIVNGADIILIPRGGVFRSDFGRKFDLRMINKARSQDLLVICAAGSHGVDTAHLSPSGLPGVLTVAAIDQKNKRPDWSSFGNAVDLAAPGVDVLSLRARGTDMMHTLVPDRFAQGEQIVEDQFSWSHGTSFAAPIVAGAASWIWMKNPQLTAEQVQRKLLMSCDDVETPGWDRLTGAGVINLPRALDADPAAYLHAQISDLELTFRGRTRGVLVKGKVYGSSFRKWNLTIAYGDEPEASDWMHVGSSLAQTSRDAGLVFVPQRLWNKPGTWWLRVTVIGSSGTIRESRRKLVVEWHPSHFETEGPSETQGGDK